MAARRLSSVRKELDFSTTRSACSSAEVVKPETGQQRQRRPATSSELPKVGEVIYIGSSPVKAQDGASSRQRQRQSSSAEVVCIDDSSDSTHASREKRAAAVRSEHSTMLLEKSPRGSVASSPKAKKSSHGSAASSKAESAVASSKATEAAKSASATTSSNNRSESVSTTEKPTEAHASCDNDDVKSFDVSQSSPASSSKPGDTVQSCEVCEKSEKISNSSATSETSLETPKEVDDSVDCTEKSSPTVSSKPQIAATDKPELCVSDGSGMSAVTSNTDDHTPEEPRDSPLPRKSPRLVVAESPKPRRSSRFGGGESELISLSARKDKQSESREQESADKSVSKDSKPIGDLHVQPSGSASTSPKRSESSPCGGGESELTSLSQKKDTHSESREKGVVEKNTAPDQPDGNSSTEHPKGEETDSSKECVLPRKSSQVLLQTPKPRRSSRFSGESELTSLSAQKEKQSEPREKEVLGENAATVGSDPEHTENSSSVQCHEAPPVSSELSSSKPRTSSRRSSRFDTNADLMSLSSPKRKRAPQRDVQSSYESATEPRSAPQGSHISSSPSQVESVPIRNSSRLRSDTNVVSLPRSNNNNVSKSNVAERADPSVEQRTPIDIEPMHVRKSSRLRGETKLVALTTPKRTGSKSRSQASESTLTRPSVTEQSKAAPTEPHSDSAPVRKSSRLRGDTKLVALPVSKPASKKSVSDQTSISAIRKSSRSRNAMQIADSTKKRTRSGSVSDESSSAKHKQNFSVRSRVRSNSNPELESPAKKKKRWRTRAAAVSRSRSNSISADDDGATRVSARRTRSRTKTNASSDCESSRSRARSNSTSRDKNTKSAKSSSSSTFGEVSVRQTRSRANSSSASVSSERHSRSRSRETHSGSNAAASRSRRGRSRSRSISTCNVDQKGVNKGSRGRSRRNSSSSSTRSTRSGRSRSNSLSVNDNETPNPTAAAVSSNPTSKKSDSGEDVVAVLTWKYQSRSRDGRARSRKMKFPQNVIKNEVLRGFVLFDGFFSSFIFYLGTKSYPALLAHIYLTRAFRQRQSENSDAVLTELEFAAQLAFNARLR